MTNPYDMKPSNIPIAIAIIVSFVACKSDEEKTSSKENIFREFPQVVDIGQLKRTSFAATLENSIEENKNVIYAPTLLYAWDAVKKELKAPIKVTGSHPVDFKLLNKSTTHLNALTPSEYSIEVNVMDAITAKAYFKKSLPFDIRFQRLNDVVPFDKVIVDAFGMQEYDADIASYAQVLYYLDDDHFVLKLTPKDKQHEIILVEGLKGINALSDAVNQTHELVYKGKVEMNQRKHQWKYAINNSDKFTIPVIMFNIEATFNNLSGQTFMAGNKKHFIESAMQRTALILDEQGAIVESEATFTTDTAGHSPVIQHPKNMLFNKTFYVIIKRVDQTNPYFVMKVANSELLVKSE